MIEHKVLKRRDAILDEHQGIHAEVAKVMLAEKLASKEILSSEALRVQGEDFLLRITALKEAASGDDKLCGLIDATFSLEHAVGMELKKQQAREALHQAQARLQLRMGKGRPKELALGVIQDMLESLDRKSA